MATSVCIQMSPQRLLWQHSLEVQPTAFLIRVGAYLCRSDPSKGRVVLWQRVADSTASENEADSHSRALASYALAHDACQNDDQARFDKYIQQTRALWADMGNPTLPGFIERHINMGVCKECAAEMSGVMDGHEIRFKQFILAQTRHGLGGAAAVNGNDADNSGAGSSGGKGARLVPGGTSSEIEPASSSKAQAPPQMSQSSVAASRAGIAALEAEMRKGYELYEEGRLVPP